MQDKTYILELAYTNGTAKHWKVDRNRAFDLFEDQNRDTITDISSFGDQRPTLTLWTLKRVHDRMEVTGVTLRCKVYIGMDQTLMLEIGRQFGNATAGRPLEYGRQLAM